MEEGEGRRVGMKRKGCRRGYGGDGGRRTRRFFMEKDVVWGCSGEKRVGESAGRWPDVLKINELFVDKYKKNRIFAMLNRAMPQLVAAWVCAFIGLGNELVKRLINRI